MFRTIARMILALLALLALTSQPARAQCESGSGENGVALLIGISTYSGVAGAAGGVDSAIFAGMLARSDGVDRNDEQARYWTRLALTQLDEDRRGALYRYTRRLIR